MKCESAREYFSDLIEKSLEPGKQVAVEAHLAACPTCHAEFDGLQALWPHYDTPSFEPPADLTRRIRVALREENSRRLARRGFLKRVSDRVFNAIPAKPGYAMAAAAVLLVALPGAVRLAAPDQFAWFTTSVLGLQSKPVLTGVSAIKVTPVLNPADPSRWDIRISGVKDTTFLRVRQMGANPVTSGSEYALDVRLRADQGMTVIAGRQIEAGETTISALPLPETSKRGVNVVIVDLARGDSRRVALFLPTNRQLPPLTVQPAQPQNYITGLWRVSNDFQAPVVADVYLRKEVPATRESVVGLAEFAPQAELRIGGESPERALGRLGAAANLDVSHRNGITYLTRKPQ